MAQVKPVNVNINPNDLTYIIRLINTTFDPKKPGSGAIAIGRTIKTVIGGPLSIIMRNMQSLQSILDPILSIIGLIGDVIVIAILPELKRFFSQIGGLARGLISGGATGPAVSKFIVGFVTAIVPVLVKLIEILANIIVSLILDPKMWVTLVDLLIIALLLTIKVVTEALTGLLKGFFSLATGDTAGLGALASGLGMAGGLSSTISALASTLFSTDGDLYELMRTLVAGPIAILTGQKFTDVLSQVKTEGTWSVLMSSASTMIMGLLTGSWFFELLYNVGKFVVNFLLDTLGINPANMSAGNFGKGLHELTNPVKHPFVSSVLGASSSGILPIVGLFTG